MVRDADTEIDDEAVTDVDGKCDADSVLEEVKEGLTVALSDLDAVDEPDQVGVSDDDRVVL